MSFAQHMIILTSVGGDLFIFFSIIGNDILPTT